MAATNPIVQDKRERSMLSGIADFMYVYRIGDSHHTPVMYDGKLVGSCLRFS